MSDALRGGAVFRYASATTIPSRSKLASGVTTGALLAWMAWLLLLLLIALGGPRHEPWFDEAQAWLIAQDNSPWRIVSHAVRYEGTPGLWHLTLWTVQRLGLPYRDFFWVSGVAALTGAGVMLWKAPFPIWMRIGFAFSYTFAYQYAAVARSYSLDAALVPIVAALFASRLKRPVAYGAALGLLANANAHSLILSAPLSVEWLIASVLAGRRFGWPPRHALAGMAIFGALALAAVAQTWPPHDPTFDSINGVHLSAWRPVLLLLEGLIDRTNPFINRNASVQFYVDGAALTFLVLAPCFVLAHASGKLGLVSGLFGSLTAFFVVMYGNYWHAALFALVLPLCLWISWDGLPRLTPQRRVWLLAACAIFLSYQALYTTLAWARDLMTPYSGARAAALDLTRIRHDQPDARIAGVGFKTYAVQPYFADAIFANAGPGRPRYDRWIRGSGVPLYATPSYWAGLVAAQSYDWLLLSADSRTHAFRLAPYAEAARLQGYCLKAVFPGQLVWKARIAEDDTLDLFGRCGRSSLTR